MIDHLHNFKGDEKIYERISNFAHALQNFAQKNDVAVVILAQVSYDTQKMKDHENITAKGSKDMEEVSDSMIALLRNRDEPDMKIKIIKNREGSAGIVECLIKFPHMTIHKKNI